MKLVEILESSVWETFQVSHPWAQFTQSWAWGEFRRTQGVRVKRFALIEDTGEWLAAAQMEFRPRRFGVGYWFAPRGPVFSAHLDAERIRTVFSSFIELLLKQNLEHALFWRFEPAVEVGAPEGLMPMRFRRNDGLNPSSTILLDLAPSPEELLAALHQKTRYNIRLAAKHGVTTRLASKPGDLEAFLHLMDETASRDGFVQHDREYLKATYAFLEHEGMARIRVAEHGGKALAANLEILYGDTVTYLYGSSSSEARHVMAPFALHWDAISQAKRDGFGQYDFWGANPESKATFAYKDSWEGITRFKRGWGGRQVDLYGTWDLPFIMPVYHLLFRKNFLRG